MRAMYALAALGGLFVGVVAGGFGTAWFFSDMTGRMVAAAWRDGATNGLAEATTYLRLLDDGKTDVLRMVLVGDLQMMTISLADGHSDINSELLRKQMKIVDRLKSVQADDSDIGKIAADARKRILDAPKP